MSRSIIIGDIHGCYDELMTLLQKCKRRPDEAVIALGDLVDRGPYPWKVVDFFMQDPQAFSILGNHEDKHIRIRKGESSASKSQVICKYQLGVHYNKAIDYFESLPLWYKIHNYYLVHAAALSDTPVPEQPRNVLLRGRMPWMKHPFDRTKAPWWSSYTGKHPIIYGHRIHEYPHSENRTIGIDTGCCHGYKLTALIMPEMRFVQVPAKRDYWGHLPNQYRHLYQRTTPSKRTTKNIIVEDTKIDRSWLLKQYPDKPPGNWIGDAFRIIHETHQKKQLSTVSEIKTLLEVFNNSSKSEKN